MAVLFSEYVSTQSSWYSQPYSVSQYLGSGKTERNHHEILNLLYENLWCIFCFRGKLQMLVDAAWDKDNRVCMCVCVFIWCCSCLTDKSMDFRSYGDHSSSVNVTEFCQYTLIHSAGHMVPGTISKALNIHGNACSYFKIVTIT